MMYGYSNWRSPHSLALSLGHRRRRRCMVILIGGGERALTPSLFHLVTWSVTRSFRPIGIVPCRNRGLKKGKKNWDLNQNKNSLILPSLLQMTRSLQIPGILVHTTADRHQQTISPAAALTFVVNLRPR